MKNQTFERPPMVPPGSTQPTCERARVPGDPTAQPRTPPRAMKSGEFGSYVFHLNAERYKGNQDLLVEDVRADVKRLTGQDGREPAFLIWVDDKKTAIELRNKLGNLGQWAAVSVSKPAAG
jgi:hypothetical protein